MLDDWNVLEWVSDIQRVEIRKHHIGSDFALFRHSHMRRVLRWFGINSVGFVWRWRYHLLWGVNGLANLDVIHIFHQGLQIVSDVSHNILRLLWLLVLRWKYFILFILALGIIWRNLALRVVWLKVLEHYFFVINHGGAIYLLVVFSKRCESVIVMTNWWLSKVGMILVFLP